MRKLDLREYEQSSPYTLSVAQRDNLRDAVPSLAIEPVAGENATYRITPSSTGSERSRQAISPSRYGPR